MTEKIKDIPKELIPTEIQPLLDSIAEHLVKRGVHVGYLQDQNHQLMLGDCAFWLNYDKENNTVSLGFSQNPLHWDVKLIELSLMEDKHQFMVEKGASFVKEQGLF